MEEREDETLFSTWVNWEQRVISFTPENGFEELTFPTHIVVAYNYRDMLCGIQHSCYSAPASVAFLHIIPFGFGIIACVIIAFLLRRKAK